jgi:hypothetical protein
MAVRMAALAVALGLCVAFLFLWPMRCDVARPDFIRVVVILLTGCPPRLAPGG